MINKIHKDSILPDEQIDFYMRRDSPNLYSALNKCAQDLENKGHLIIEGWRVSDLLKEAALNLMDQTSVNRILNQ